MDDVRMTPEELKGDRLALPASQQELADFLGVRRDTVARWESGRDLIPLRIKSEIEDVARDRVIRLHQHFGI